MQAFWEKLGPYIWQVTAVIVVIALLLAAWAILRRVFNGRIRASGGGRARQPRLGVVDAFDLDRERQLVLIRRDNVEHLVMIGGPNDVLIESEIIRAGVQAPEGRARGGHGACAQAELGEEVAPGGFLWGRAFPFVKHRASPSS